MPTDTPALVRIILQSLWPRGCHPQRMLGRFVGDDLVYCEAPDMGLSWERKPGESPNDYERRIVEAILLARHLPPLPPPLPLVEALHANAPQPPKVNLRHEPHGHGHADKLAAPSAPPAPFQRWDRRQVFLRRYAGVKALAE